MQKAGTAAVATLVALIALSGCAPAAPPPATDGQILEVLEGFYAAMKTGDTAAAMSRIAPDAFFVESGRLETREQYETSHLPADIEFESVVPGTRGEPRVTINGDTAWVIVTTEYEGTFQMEPVHFVSAQLMVLSRDAANVWMIRSIHWSSRRLTP